jgi:hypothetical protein
MRTTMDVGGMTGTSPNLEAHLSHVLTRRRARAKVLRQLTREELPWALELAYGWRLYLDHVQISTGELVHLILELELPVPKW